MNMTVHKNIIGNVTDINIRQP